GEECPAEFFRCLIEPLCDSFDPDQAAAYDQLMTAWIAPRQRVQPVIPAHVRSVYVLSRVTLGADIKITSIILDAMKRRFPEAVVVFVASRKSFELFTADPLIKRREAHYPRTGSIRERVAFAHSLEAQLNVPNTIVVDPDSRMTQL